MKTKIVFLLTLFFVTGLLSAQEKITDKLVKRDGTTVLCKIKEIGDDEIKYSEEGLREDILIGIDKSKVDKIIFADGREYKIDNAMSVYEDLSTQRKNVFKFNLFLPISGAVEFGYERSIKPGSSVEGEIGIIYGNDNFDVESSGMFFKAGYKLMRSPDFYTKGMKYAHLLKGGYIKPEIAVTTFNYDFNYYYSTTPSSGSTTNLAFLINFGKQWVYRNRMAIDLYVGAGYALGNMDESLNSYYAFMSFNGESAFVLTSGLRVGFLF